MALDLSWRFDRWFDRLPRSPRDAGHVVRCVLRAGHGLRETPGELQIVAGHGVVGDSWGTHDWDEEGNQVALVNVHVIRALCDGDEARTALSGDNLQVDLELSEANLPTGTRLAVGSEVVLVVSPVPHRPCQYFHERFGASGAKKVARANRRGLRGRGVLCSVERGGRVRCGDPIRVERPGPSAGAE